MFLVCTHTGIYLRCEDRTCVSLSDVILKGLNSQEVCCVNIRSQFPSIYSIWRWSANEWWVTRVCKILRFDQSSSTCWQTTQGWQHLQSSRSWELYLGFRVSEKFWIEYSRYYKASWMALGELMPWPTLDINSLGVGVLFLQITNILEFRFGPQSLEVMPLTRNVQSE